MEGVYIKRADKTGSFVKITDIPLVDKEVAEAVVLLALKYKCEPDDVELFHIGKYPGEDEDEDDIVKKCLEKKKLRSS
jgi:hypothetical protein